FATGSILLFEGQEVGVGTPIGLCGNSGNSPQPHIHIQVQTSIFPTAPTIPFVFVNYGQGGEYVASGLPQVKADIQHCSFSLFYDQLTNFVLDDCYRYEVWHRGSKVKTINLKVKMSETLVTFFESDKGRLYFGKQYGNFFVYSIEGSDPYLRLIYLALSMMPMSDVTGLKWGDRVNNSLVLNRWQQLVASLLNSFFTHWVTTTSNYQLQDKTIISGQLRNSFFEVEMASVIELDPQNRISRLQVGPYEMRQIAMAAEE
ncbi:MAG: hypothetical protein HQL48_08585, partial [Gammaproteobacteria bacterium]|nr:hypothetical protein [Gammaproteobacteria bacterium]